VGGRREDGSLGCGGGDLGAEKAGTRDIAKTCSRGDWDGSLGGGSRMEVRGEREEGMARGKEI
jgi:hypothetical protein